MMNQIPFRKSWYSNGYRVLTMASIAAFCVVFYTTENPTLYSLQSPKHLIVFAFSFVLFLVAGYLIAYVVYKLDHVSSTFAYSAKRWVIQALALGVLFPMLCLQAVYTLYLLCFGKDLRYTEYFERDFVVVMACLLAMQAYYKIKYDSLERKQLETDREKHRNRLANLQIENIEEGFEHKNILSEIEVLSDRLQEVEGREKIWRSYLDELMKPIEVNHKGEKFTVVASQLREVYLEEHNRKMKNISGELLDGREVMMDLGSLKAVEEIFKHIFFRASRDNLIVHMWVDTLIEENGQYSVMLRGKDAKSISLSAEKYHELKDLREWYFSIAEMEDRE